MAIVTPFPALMFTARDAAALADRCCPPYDIIPDDMAAELRARPANAIHLELPEGDDTTRYENARKVLDRWLAEGVLAQEDADAFYIYEEEFTVPGTETVKKLRGLIGRVGLVPFSEGVVLPHEETLSKAKEDRFRLMRATGCNFSHIYSLYMDDEHSVTPYIDKAAEAAPDAEFTDAAGVIQRLWIVRDPEVCAAVTAGFADKKLYIADGHHRYETALRYRDTLRAEQGTAGAADSVMMMLVDMDSDGLVVLPTHRVVFGLEDFSAEKALAGAAAHWDAAPLEGDPEAALDAAEKVACVLVTAEGKWMLTRKDDCAMAEALPEKSEAYRGLDVAALHALILEPVFGIDKANMASQKNLRYTRSAAEACADVAEGKAQCAFLIRGTRVRQIRDVASAGEKMPQKSTYFYPKIITGLVMNRF